MCVSRATYVTAPMTQRATGALLDALAPLGVRSPLAGISENAPAMQRHFCTIGGAKGDRTPDLVIANHALSQLSYSPGIWQPQRESNPSFRLERAVS